jgi:small subunit ribosomal protein S20
MANHKSAEKKHRKDTKKRLANVSRLSRVRTFVKKIEETLKKGADVTVAAQEFRTAQSELMRGASKGVLHRKTASRKVARLASKLNALTAS